MVAAAETRKRENVPPIFKCLNRGQIAGITISVLVVIAVIVIAVVLSGAAAKKSENIIIAAQQQKDGTIKISTSTDTGSTWIDVKHPFTKTVSSITTNGVTFYANDTDSFATSSDGEHWSALTRVTPLQLVNSVHIDNEGKRLIAIGRDNSSGGSIVYSDDKGKTWVICVLPNDTATIIRATFDGKTWWVITSDREILKSVDNATTWYNYSKMGSLSDIVRVTDAIILSFKEKENLVKINDDNKGHEITFENVEQSKALFYALASNGTNGVVAGSDTGYMISIDGGTNWKQVDTTQVANPAAVLAWTGKRFLVASATIDINSKFTAFEKQLVDVTAIAGREK